ncbi:flavin reductase family protein [Limibacillus halophilus]|uniref:Flavin reductase (DIM6/NTAB) family NADH-FMN oxidoreductase RutF n=1 Tax=Limibacillus halophilus TaxID=1579333 RepID=A0A839SXU9_9PROT|nr:flavin reductase family protein [Limibacillus halophilus]MBB3066909.1 flavin reductase (DIM6/NTAB) family NADH-FMN oxidoreductase RutF [Limibacillus halophilus]
MYYEAGQHKAAGLPYNPFKAIVAPRPIGWITTLDGQGRINLAPYSFFNAVSDSPPTVFFASSGRSREVGVKDSQANAEETGEFVCNMATWDLRDAMNKTSASLPAGEDEAAFAGLEMVPSRLVKPPRVKASPVHLECRYLQTLELPSNDPDNGNFVVFGEVVAVHIDDAMIDEKGLLDVTRYKPIARLGYMDYAVVEQVFSMDRPS